MTDAQSDSMREEKPLAPIPRPVFRHPLPDDRHAMTHKFSVGGHEGYITVGLYGDGTPGEIFLTMTKVDSTISGLLDAFATAISLLLQYGVPLEKLVEKFSFMRFEPAGYTTNPEVPIAKSIVDYAFRYLASRFLTATKETPSMLPPPLTVPDPDDAPNCHHCGHITVRDGGGYACLNCGEKYTASVTIPNPC